MTKILSDPTVDPARIDLVLRDTVGFPQWEIDALTSTLRNLHGRCIAVWSIFEVEHALFDMGYDHTEIREVTEGL